jgi:hypothetical protein
VEEKKTILRTHIWEMRDEGETNDIKWELNDRAATLKPKTKNALCDVCLKEKYHIMYSKDPHLLNKRNEVSSSCRHMAQKRLSNVE